MYDLHGKVALVTGAGGERGIGRAIAIRLAQEGADVIVNDLARNPYAERLMEWGGLPDVVREIESLGRQAMEVQADVSDSAQVDAMVRRGMERFGHIDILVNNAGSRPGRDRVPVYELEEEDWDLVQRVNVKGTFLCSKAVSLEMIRRGAEGKIIIISSNAGKRGRARFAAYCASKFALVGFTQSLALDLAPYHVNVNAICPGGVDTERADYISAALVPEGESFEEFHAQRILEADQSNPLGRVAQSLDVAKMAAFLASAESDYITGLSLSVSGGVVMD